MAEGKGEGGRAGVGIEGVDEIVPAGVADEMEARERQKEGEGVVGDGGGAVTVDAQVTGARATRVGGDDRGRRWGGGAEGQDGRVLVGVGARRKVGAGSREGGGKGRRWRGCPRYALFAGDDARGEVDPAAGEAGRVDAG